MGCNLKEQRHCTLTSTLWLEYRCKSIHATCMCLVPISVNDGYFINYGVHLNRQSTNRIAKNLKLKVKDDIKDISKPYKARPTSPRYSNSRPQRLPQSKGLTAGAAEDTSRPAHTSDWTRVNGRNRRHWHAQEPGRNSGNEHFRRNQRHKFEMNDFQHKRQPASDTKFFLLFLWWRKPQYGYLPLEISSGLSFV